MNYRKHACFAASMVAAGEALGTAVMIGIFALLGRYDTSVLLGGLAGAALATLNFFLMALGVGVAEGRAAKWDLQGGQLLIRLSYIGRMAGLFLALILCIKSGRCNALALVIPLVFVWPTLSMGEIFRRKRGRTA